MAIYQVFKNCINNIFWKIFRNVIKFAPKKMISP